MNNKEKLGIVLEGGGAKGAYQLGAWKALEDLKIEYDGVVGTSIGAINAAAMVLGDLEENLKLWSSINFAKLLLPRGDVKREDITRKTIDFSFIKKDIDSFMNQFLNRRGIDIKPILHILKDNVDEEEIRKSKKDFGLTTYCLTDKEPLELFKEQIPEGFLSEYIFASCYLPIFNAQKINGKYFLDGGYFNNLPINMLVKKGYKKIIAIRLRPEEYDYSQYKDIEIIDIKPDEYLCGTLDVNVKKSQGMIRKGYIDTVRAINKR